ncbi:MULTISPECIES: AAC(3) family N-acetyltransferase [Streptacidiphilus]|uniref:Aminoglycoside N(3)-acetyltransferase n=1 Tax=Streptacidiphilus cavernicola TaxID=3342716 RepID=A0ABV6UQ15_9ACTN|nr:AAC(3) family N-acetyltransferase [Streptacidiphilus jeojiense]
MGELESPLPDRGRPPGRPRKPLNQSGYPPAKLAWLEHVRLIVDSSFGKREVAASALKIDQGELSRRLNGKLADLDFVRLLHEVCTPRYGAAMPPIEKSNELFLAAVREADPSRFEGFKSLLEVAEENRFLADRVNQLEMDITVARGLLAVEKESADQLARQLQNALDRAEAGEAAWRTLLASVLGAPRQEWPWKSQSGQVNANDLEQELVRDFLSLGIRPGIILYVHMGLVHIDRTTAQVMTWALRRVLGPKGTVVISTATPENSAHGPVYETLTRSMTRVQLEEFHEFVPAFDRVASPSSQLLTWLSEEIRCTPGALRSGHPLASVAAVGPHAAEITRSHAFESTYGFDSPFGNLYLMDAQVLILGAPQWDCPIYYTADYMLDRPPTKNEVCKVRDSQGQRMWVSFETVDHASIHTPEVVQSLEQAIGSLLESSRGMLGPYTAHLLSVRDGVDTAYGRLAAAIS